MFLNAIAADISAATRIPFSIADTQEVGGGSIHRSQVIKGHCGRAFFVKINRADRIDLFEAETHGLRELARSGCIRVPEPIALGSNKEAAWLVLEHLALSSHGDATALGRALASLHRCTAPRFGGQRDNYIGSTLQPNAWDDDWITFWREHRLGFQLEIARRNGAPDSLIKASHAVINRLPDLFADYRPVPSLLHGDLWSGNAAYINHAPCLFDPAVYYGDREADIAMTELFGGFSPTFYAAYREAWPLDPGYERRRTLYNLYHLLNHYNLFGGSYGKQAEQGALAILA